MYNKGKGLTHCSLAFLLIWLLTFEEVYYFGVHGLSNPVYFGWHLQCYFRRRIKKVEQVNV